MRLEKIISQQKKLVQDGYATICDQRINLSKSSLRQKRLLVRWLEELHLRRQIDNRAKSRC